MNIKIIIIVLVFLLYSLNSETFEVDKNNLFIVNYLILSDPDDSGPLYYLPNFVDEITDKKIKTIDFLRGNESIKTVYFNRYGHIESVFRRGIKLQDYTYKTVGDTLYVSDSLNQSFEKYFFTDGRITSYSGDFTLSNGTIIEYESDVNYEEDYFSFSTYTFDYDRRLLSFGSYSKNVFKTFFCGNTVDIYRELSYKQDTVINTINESNLKKHYRQTLPLHNQFNYISIKDTNKNSYDVIKDNKLSYRIILNDKGLVSNVIQYYNDDIIEEYSFLYTYYE